MSTSRNSARSGGGRHLLPDQVATRRALNGSLTQTITPEDTASSRSASPDSVVLRLRGAHDASAPATSTRRRIQWAEDVVDNEGLGRKSSKVCCIYHKTRVFGESSSEDDSSSSSDNDSDVDGSDSPDDGGARMSGSRKTGKGGRNRKTRHDHKHDDNCQYIQGNSQKKPRPNAYEKMPKHNTTPASSKS